MNKKELIMQTKSSYSNRRNRLLLFAVVGGLMLLGSCKSAEKVIVSPFQQATNIRVQTFKSQDFTRGRAELQALLNKYPSDIEVRVINAVTYLDEYLLAVNREGAQPSQSIMNKLIDELLTINKALIGEVEVANWVESTLHNAFATALLLDSRDKIKSAETEESLGIVYAQLFAAEEIAQNVLNYVQSIPADSVTPGVQRAKKAALDNIIAAKNGELEALTQLFGISNATATAEKNQLMDEVYKLLTDPEPEIKDVPPAYSFWNFDAFKYIQLADGEFLLAGQYMAELQGLCEEVDAANDSLPAEVLEKQQQVIDLAKKSLAHEILGLRLAKRDVGNLGVKFNVWKSAYNKPCQN